MCKFIYQDFKGLLMSVINTNFWLAKPVFKRKFFEFWRVSSAAHETNSKLVLLMLIAQLPMNNLCIIKYFVTKNVRNNRIIKNKSYTMSILAQEFQTCGLCWQSHLNERTYWPGLRDFGTSTRSLKAHFWEPTLSLGKLTLTHSEPGGLVPTLVFTIGFASQFSGSQGPFRDA